MPDPVSPLNGAIQDGFARVREIGPLGMITLRAAPDTPGLAEAIRATAGTAVPERRRILREGDRACGWMAPDEYLLILPYAEVGAAIAAIDSAMAGQHHLAVDVSDARAVFRVEGAKAAQALAKLTPADVERLERDELRRTRLAQVAAAFWAADGGYTVVTFRSVAAYAFGLLAHSAKPGSEIA